MNLVQRCDNASQACLLGGFLSFDSTPRPQLLREVVAQAQPLSMAWCLDCHRNPEKYVRPVDEVTTIESGRLETATSAS